jgi:hypothetical protein
MAKVKCPGCGAKNDSLSRRCRVCTKVINTNVSDEAAPAAPRPAPRRVMEDHFDANVLESQLVAPKARFSGGGGLSARIAAANGGALPPPSFGKNAGEGTLELPHVELPATKAAKPERSSAPSTSWDPSDLFAPDPGLAGPPAPSAGPPPPAADDHFDADALFRDMGR